MKLVEIQARLAYSGFEVIIPMLRTLASPRFRKLTLFVTPPLPVDKTHFWTGLDEEVTVLAKRVNATAANDRLEVLFFAHSTAIGGSELSDIEAALPRIASDVCVSFRVESLSQL